RRADGPRTVIIAAMSQADAARLVGDPGQVPAAARVVRERTALVPRIGLILGSGLGALADEVDGVSVPYAELPGMPVSSAPGHAGRLHVGYLEGREVAVMQGRAHLYEGFTAAQVTYPVALLAALGVRSVVVTN